MAKGKRVCSDECEHCIYIGDGDFICDILDDIVISDWFNCHGICTVGRGKDEEKESF